MSNTNKKVTEIDLPLHHVETLRMPFVLASFMSKSGEWRQGFFLIDTGSTDNILNCDKLGAVDEASISSRRKTIFGMENKGEDCARVQLDINVGGLESTETFSISHNLDFKKFFGSNDIIGLLGVKYLRKNRLVLDFDARSLHTSHLKRLDCDNWGVIIPMGYGFEMYGLPMAPFTIDDKVYPCIVDSGADYSLLTQLAMEQGTVQYDHHENEAGTIEGMAGVTHTSFADVTFKLVSLTGTEDKIAEIEDREKFHIVPDSDGIYIIPDSDVPSVQGMLSTPYMLQRKWILDFKIGYIYSKIS